MRPEYPCAHCISQGSAASVLEAFFGDAVPDLHDDQHDRTRSNAQISKLSDYVSEVVNARVYDGVHYRTSGEFGQCVWGGQVIRLVNFKPNLRIELLTKNGGWDAGQVDPQRRHRNESRPLHPSQPAMPMLSIIGKFFPTKAS